MHIFLCFANLHFFFVILIANKMLQIIMQLCSTQGIVKARIPRISSKHQLLYSLSKIRKAGTIKSNNKAEHHHQTRNHISGK